LSYTPVTVALLRMIRRRQGRPLRENAADIGIHRERVEQVRELHKPRWDNCMNGCCSGEQCRHRTRSCAGGCDEWVNDNHDYWPCATARLVYSADELAELT
jgi:hypothetical protein